MKPTRHVLQAMGLAVATVTLGLSPAAHSASGKLVLTGGVSTIEGSGGGGLTPWALIGTQATDNEWGVAANVSQARTQDYRLDTLGAMVAWDDRLEFSVGSQSLDTGPTSRQLGAPGQELDQVIVGVKYRVLGEAILDADTWLPQVAVGVQHKRLDAGNRIEGILNSVGADTSGTDFYVSATKLFLKPAVLINATLRATEANQNGLLGFGANGSSGYQIMPEVSVAKLLRNNLAVGAEYRAMPDNLELRPVGGGRNGLASDDWKDVFVAWAPRKNVSLTAGYVDLGRIVPATTSNRDQTGYYVSAQFSY
ncbi:DUF3034 family protein [Perlucidibaca piscinae]|uniref:DUF3034 family protein n=1 Tax=Perlucidibaca piscinae TaxID=392589 RepID=UPI0004298513|nr:DUF3034 family protein [Perlucidibaca piscinae]